MSYLKKLDGFPPIVSKSPRIIILGSMPGRQSLKQNQYYAHPQNQFWKILEKLLKHECLQNYSDKKKMLTNRRIILWDVVRSCRRKGSLDSNLKNIQINDFKKLFKKCHALRAVFCNGLTAYTLFNRFKGNIDLPVFRLPSTSPAYTISFQQKLVKWRKILKFIK